MAAIKISNGKQSISIESSGAVQTKPAAAVAPKTDLVASAESWVDLDEMLIQSTEAYVVANVKCEGVFELAKSLAARSSEAVDLKAAGAKIAAGAKKAWEAIVNFFQKIGAYVSSFLKSAPFRVKAAIVGKKFAKFGADANWTNMTYNAPGGSVKAFADKCNKLKAAAVKVEGTEDQIAKLMTEANVADSSSAVKLVTWFGTNNANDIMANVHKYASGGMKEIKDLQELQANATAKMKEAQAMAKKDNTSKEELAKYRNAVKLSNMAVKAHIKFINCYIDAANQIVAKPAKPEAKK